MRKTIIILLIIATQCLAGDFWQPKRYDSYENNTMIVGGAIGALGFVAGILTAYSALSDEQWSMKHTGMAAATGMLFISGTITIQIGKRQGKK